MRRRFWFAVATVMATSLAVGVGMAGAAAPKAQKLTCKISLATTPPSGSNTVNQPPSQGNQYGPVNCGTPGFGRGVGADVFTVPDSGDMVGTYTEYFKAGTVKGSFDLTPQEGAPISSTTFESQTWVGKVKITGGTGVFGLIKEQKGTGVLKCSTLDSVHLNCKEKIKLTAI